jgi:DNA-binding NtrC family response regulator
MLRGAFLAFQGFLEGKDLNSSCRKNYKKGKILLVSRDKLFNKLFSSWMTQERFDFMLVETFDEVIPALRRKRFDVVVPTNMCLPADEIPDLVARLKQESSEVGIFVISGWTEIKEEVLLRGGKFHEAPIPLEEFSCRVKYIIARRRKKMTNGNILLH